MCSRNDYSEVSPTLKFVLFFFNSVFWLTGVTFIVVGSWAFVQKNRYTFTSSDEPPKYLEAFDLVFDLTILMVVLGCVIFVIAFAGCVGALRENICLLKFFMYMLGALFLAEVILAILAFVFTNEIKAKVVNVLELKMLARYRDDDDLRNLIDWTQRTFKCCGVGEKGYKDWSQNIYFNCNADNPSMERCGVPYSCCIRPNDVTEYIINTACGHNKQDLPPLEAMKDIFTNGCIEEILGYARLNLYIIGGVTMGIALLLILGIFLAKTLVNQVEAQKELW